MLYLKAFAREDAEIAYKFFQEIPYNENGFINKFYGVSKDEFINVHVDQLLKEAKGIDLEIDRVPQTLYFLYEDEKIVGLFKVRHYLNEVLRNGSGHIGFGIHPNFRNHGYATKGLAQAIQELNKIITEDEIYMSCNINNPASLRVQLKNGAYIHHNDHDHHYTRIKVQ